MNEIDNRNYNYPNARELLICKVFNFDQRKLIEGYHLKGLLLLKIYNNYRNFLL